MKNDNLSEQGVTLKELNEILPKEDKNNTFYHSSKIREAVKKLKDRIAYRFQGGHSSVSDVCNEEIDELAGEEQKDILKDIPEEEYEILAVKCLILLNDLMNKKSFHNEGSIEQRKEKYESKSNFLEEFINLFIQEDTEGFITKSDFNKKFLDWCKEKRHRQISETSLGSEMKKIRFESSTKHLNWMNEGRGDNFCSKCRVKDWKLRFLAIRNAEHQRIQACKYKNSTRIINDVPGSYYAKRREI